MFLIVFISTFTNGTDEEYNFFGRFHPNHYNNIWKLDINIYSYLMRNTNAINIKNKKVIKSIIIVD